MSSRAVAEVLARWRAACDEVAALPFDTLPVSERLAVLDECERARRRQPAVEHRLIAGLRAQCTPAQLGAANWREVLTERLRISAADAGRRLEEAGRLGPRTALTGEVLEPLWPNVAKRQAAGQIDAEHIAIIRNFFHDPPAAVDYQTREGCEETLATLAARHTPEELRKLAARLAALINPDGEFDDTDRARNRFVRLGPQQADGTSELRGRVDADLRAALEAVNAKWAAPGMCSPDDEAPCVDRRTRRRGRAPRHPHGRPTQPRRTQSHGPRRSGLRATRPTHRAADHRHRLHHPAGTAIGRRGRPSPPAAPCCPCAT